MNEDWCAGYDEGYQNGWNAAIDASTAQQPVKEVELTDDEIANVRKSLGNGVIGAVDFARAVIAADREKNK